MFFYFLGGAQRELDEKTSKLRPNPIKSRFGGMLTENWVEYSTSAE